MAKTRCPARYKNLGLETFGNKRKVTDEILKQCCKNDEWLRQQVEELRYLTPPAVRKSLKIAETIDEDKSWGCKVEGNKVVFSNIVDKDFDIDLTTEEGLQRWFDEKNSNVKAYTRTNTDGSISHYISLEKIFVEGAKEYFGTAELFTGYNSAWYVGFDKSKNFYLKPSWIKNWKNIDIKKETIPAIARAQTFKVPEGKGGELVGLDLQLEYNGTPTMSSSPLYVQIWETKDKWAKKTEWDNDKKQAVRKFMKISDFESAYPNDELPSTWQKYSKIKVPRMKYNKKKKVFETVKYKKGAKKDQVVYDIVYQKDSQGKYIKAVEKIKVPKSKKGKSIRNPLAEYVYNPTGITKGGEPHITFPNAPKLTEGESYAIVLLSPLNNWENCPRWAGWGRNCKRDKLYPDGDAFYSTNNGVSWRRYGKNGKTEEEIKEYKQGKYTPQDYRFRCITKISPDTVTYPTEIKKLHLNPIYGNPIYKVIITPSGGKGGWENSRSDKLYIDYQLSTDGDNWESFTYTSEGLVFELDTPSRVVFLRALLYSEDENASPEIERIHVELKMNLPTEMYARTKPYTPEKFGTILGASVWGRVFAPYTLSNSSLVDCKVDIIQTKENKEHIEIVSLDSLSEKMDDYDMDNSWIADKTEDGICRYLTEHPSILNELKEKNIYILPHEMDDGMHNLSFAPSDDELIVQYIGEQTIYAEGDSGDFVTSTGTYKIYPDNIAGIPLIKEVAYPIINCVLEPENTEGHGEVASYGEWYDYTFDYQNNELIFKRDTLNRMPYGSLVISYNPVFVKDLTNDEIGIHYDEDGNRTDGLILDYFKETIRITDDEVDSQRVKLKVDAVDPIRQVNLYNTSLEEPITLIEDSDYYYDIDSHELVFEEIVTGTTTSVINVDDILEVVYTPNLDDTSICIGYNATRTNTDAQCTIDDYYIEYKV